ncbi:MAG: 6-carboxytetrahydropterin synthase [Bernardetiaceae bacterium]
MLITLSQKAHFNALYTTHNPHWSAEQNEAAFGKNHQENPRFHGHNYNIQVTLQGQPEDLQTGMLYPLPDLKKLIKNEVEERFDHKNLYLDLDDFKDTIPTVEAMAVRIWHILRPHLPQHLHLHVQVAATDEQMATYG